MRFVMIEFGGLEDKDLSASNVSFSFTRSATNWFKFLVQMNISNRLLKKITTGRARPSEVAMSCYRSLETFQSHHPMLLV